MKDLKKLKALCIELVNDPMLRPVRDANGKILKTFCNFGAQRGARAFGCNEFDNPDGTPMMAEQIIELMEANASGKWEKVPGRVASAWAQEGGLGFAGMTAEKMKEAHAHIDVLSPEPMEESGSLGHSVPMVANVGQNNAEKKESAAFPVSCGEADYYIYNG